MFFFLVKKKSHYHHPMNYVCLADSLWYTGLAIIVLW
jgi:hypothetical protein